MTYSGNFERMINLVDNSAVPDSFKRCEASGDFAEKFYEVFLSASPEIAPFFANTEFSKQRKLLRATVYVLVTRDVDDPKARDQLNKVGRSHSRSQLDIRPELYDVWLDSLCKTVGEMDPKWGADLENAWRERMQRGIAVIAAAY